MTSLNVILGAVVLAGIFGALFFGGACIQTYNYYHKYRSDSIVVQGAVAALWAANALHFAVYTYTIWYYVVDALETAWIPQIMNWCALPLFEFQGITFPRDDIVIPDADARFPLQLSVWLAVALVLLLDIFYTFYIYKLSRSFVVPGLVGLTVAAGNVTAVVLGVRIILFTHFTNIYAISASALIYLFFGLFCLKATSIAAVMTYYLARSNDGFARDSNTGIRRVVKLLVGSALFICLFSFAVLACHLAMPHSMTCVVVYMIVSKTYHNCFLSLLACRPALTRNSGIVGGLGHHDMTGMRSQSEAGRQSTMVDGSEAASIKG
ncbi:hypothetical protein K438DRAFT_1975632 [Mycena galopus ATCC 62051]|nr:hypothetical protein K438DRAFT_1975632 [Mycena galopus ATCC 62051]